MSLSLIGTDSPVGWVVARSWPPEHLERTLNTTSSVVHVRSLEGGKCSRLVDARAYFLVDM